MEALREELYQTYPFDSMEDIILNFYTAIRYTDCEALVFAWFTFSQGTEPEVMEEAGIYVLSQLDPKIAPDLQIQYDINCDRHDSSSDQRDKVSLRIENYRNQGSSLLYSPFWRLKTVEAWLSTPDKYRAPYSFSQESLAVLEQSVQYEYENENPGEVYFLKDDYITGEESNGKVGDLLPEGQYRMEVISGTGRITVKGSIACSDLTFGGEYGRTVFEHVFLKDGFDIKAFSSEIKGPFIVKCTAE